MRILQIDGLGLLRGGQAQIALLAHGLMKRGHHVAVATPAGCPFFEKLRRTGIASLPLAPFSFRTGIGLRAAVRKYRPDILHVHDSRALLASALAARWAGRIPVVASRRVAFPGRRGLSRRIKYGRAASLVIAASSYIANRLIEEGVPSGRVIVVRDGVETAGFRPGTFQGSEPADRIRRNDVTTIGALSALSPEKGLSHLIEAASIMAKRDVAVRVLIAGEGPERPRLQSMIESRSLAGVVSLEGSVDDAVSFLERLHIFAQPSLHEGLGSAILEAMAAGLPIVATRAGGIPEVVVHGETGLLVTAGRSGELADALCELALDRARARAFAQAGRARVEKEFCASAMVDGTLKVYESLVG